MHAKSNATTEHPSTLQDAWLDFMAWLGAQSVADAELVRAGDIGYALVIELRRRTGADQLADLNVADIASAWSADPPQWRKRGLTEGRFLALACAMAASGHPLAGDEATQAFLQRAYA